MGWILSGGAPAGVSRPSQPFADIDFIALGGGLVRLGGEGDRRPPKAL